MSSSRPQPRPFLAPPRPAPTARPRPASRPPAPLPARPRASRPRRAPTCASAATLRGPAWPAAGPRLPALPPRPPRGGAHRPGHRAPLTREAAALAVAAAPLQHEEGVGALRHPQRVGHQHLLRAQPHRGAALTRPTRAGRKRRRRRLAEPSGRGGARGPAAPPGGRRGSGGPRDSQRVPLSPPARRTGEPGLLRFPLGLLATGLRAAGSSRSGFSPGANGLWPEWLSSQVAGRLAFCKNLSRVCRENVKE